MKTKNKLIISLIIAGGVAYFLSKPSTPPSAPIDLCANMPDVTVPCTGSNPIISKHCVNGVYIDTGNVCPCVGSWFPIGKICNIEVQPQSVTTDVICRVINTNNQFIEGSIYAVLKDVTENRLWAVKQFYGEDIKKYDCSIPLEIMWQLPPDKYTHLFEITLSHEDCTNAEVIDDCARWQYGYSISGRNPCQ